MSNLDIVNKYEKNSCKSWENILNNRHCHIFTHLTENNELKNIPGGKKNQHKTEDRKLNIHLEKNVLLVVSCGLKN